jgi:hypothetical protein
MAPQPLPYLAMFVSGIIVGDDMEGFVGRGLAVDLAQKSQPVLVSVAGATLAEHGAIHDVEGGK